MWTIENVPGHKRGLVEKEGATSAFHSRIPLAADPACRPLAFSIVLTERERGTGYVNANRVGLGINDVMLEVGPARLTVSDLWTLIPPNISSQSRHSSLTTSSIKGFVKGLLVDKVFFCGKSLFSVRSDNQMQLNNPDICNVRNHTLRIESIVFDFRVLPTKKVVEAVIWRQSLHHRDVFVADTTLAEIVKRGSSTRLLWSGVSFTNISQIFVPINNSTGKWYWMRHVVRISMV